MWLEHIGLALVTFAKFFSLAHESVSVWHAGVVGLGNMLLLTLYREVLSVIKATLVQGSDQCAIQSELLWPR